MTARQRNLKGLKGSRCRRALRVEKLWDLAESKGSRLIVALDAVPKDPLELVAELEEYVAGVKVGLLLLLKWGLPTVSNLCKEFGGSLYMLCDFKLADIPHIMSEELKLIRELGFDGAVVHLFQGGVETVARQVGRPDLFGVVAMTHPESHLLDVNVSALLEEARRPGLEGCVIPATKLSIVMAVRKACLELTLLAPGVGAQGAEPGSAVAAGADFEIVGRAVVESANSRELARTLRDRINAVLKRRRESGSDV